MPYSFEESAPNGHAEAAGLGDVPDPLGVTTCALCAFDYAVVRIVPRVEREEFLNAGVVLFCPEQNFLGARVRLNEARLAAFAPQIDIELVNSRLAGFMAICSGDRSAGPVASLGLRERFHWLVSPKSTLLQLSPVHTGICTAPEKVLARLFRELCL